MLTSKPDFPVEAIDIFACGNTLGNSLRFVSGKDKPFRILVEVVSNIVFLIRREYPPTATFPQMFGYGHSFAEAYTTWNERVKGSESHQRIIKYGFGGLNLLVRFEAGGYVKPESSATMDLDVAHSSTSEYLDAFRASITKPTVDPQSLSLQNALAIINDAFASNSSVTRAMIFDRKTRSIRRKQDRDTLAEELPRFWVNQIPNFVLAHHDHGRFEAHIPVRDVKTDVETWKKDNRAVLSEFAKLLSTIVKLAREHGKMELRKVEGDGSRLEVRLWKPDLDRLDIEGPLGPHVKER